jgi:U3 small nucleolar ribonucleoprotein component
MVNNGAVLIQKLESEVVAAKKASLMGKAKAVEKCVDSLVSVIKSQQTFIDTMALRVKVLNKTLADHRKTGK